MVQEDYTIKSKKGKHLNLEDRIKIEIHRKNGKTIKYISEELGKSTRTIQRELKRGMVKGLLKSDLSSYDSYSYQKGQSVYEKNQRNKTGNIKIGKNHELMKYLEKSIMIDKNSPYVALELAKKEKGLEVNISLKTLYNYIKKEEFLKLKGKHLPYKKRENKKYIREKKIKKGLGKSIENRAKIVSDRVELGHWEMDLVEGKRGDKYYLLVLTCMKSRKEIIRKIKGKKSETILIELEKIIKETRYEFKTITTDNGSEFMDSEGIERLGIEHFYAHSYCSYERGSNENNNKLIRRFIPKGTRISVVSKRMIKYIEDWMNNYPRKLFGGKNSNEIFYS